MADQYPDLVFSFITPREGDIEAEDKEQVEVGQEDIMVVKGAVEGEDVATEGVVEGLVVATPGEVV